MFLHIEDHLTVRDVQERFAECFPYLTIAFYTEGHKRFAPSDRQFRINDQERIGNIRKNHHQGVLEIKSWHTVAKVEKELNDLFGLHAQVFRAGANGEAVQTTASDSLTLKEQSELAAGRNPDAGPAV